MRGGSVCTIRYRKGVANARSAGGSGRPVEATPRSVRLLPGRRVAMLVQSATVVPASASSEAAAADAGEADVRHEAGDDECVCRDRVPGPDRV